MRSMTGEFENLLLPDRCGGGSGGQGRPPLPRGAADRQGSALLCHIELDAVLDELRRFLGGLFTGEERAGLVIDDLHQALVVAHDAVRVLDETVDRVILLLRHGVDLDHRAVAIAEAAFADLDRLAVFIEADVAIFVVFVVLFHRLFGHRVKCRLCDWESVLTALVFVSECGCDEAPRAVLVAALRRDGDGAEAEKLLPSWPDVLGKPR